MNQDPLPRIKIQCPHCHTHNVEASRKPWFLHGFLLFARYGTKTIIGCKSCVTQKTWVNFFVTLVGGWWCIPWGLFTPIVLVQNLIVAVYPRSERREREQLGAILTAAEIDLSDVEVDGDGFTAQERRLLGHFVAILRSVIDADGVREPRELELATAMLVQYSGDVMSPARARVLLNERGEVEGNLTDLDHESRVMFLESAISVAIADGQLHPAERRLLFQLGQRMGFPHEFVDRVIQRLVFGKSPDNNDDGGDLPLARMILGVEASASIAQIKKRYRELVVVHHPDVVGGKGADRAAAEETTKRLNWAYDLLKRQSGCSPGVTA